MNDFPLRWIDDETPAGLPVGTKLGVPFARGELASVDDFAVIADGAPSGHPSAGRSRPGPTDP